MGIGRKTLLALGASLAVLAFGAPAFASGAHPGSLKAGLPMSNGSSSTSTCNFYVSNMQVTSTPKFPVSQFTLAITVNDNDAAVPGPWYFPDPAQVSGSPVALPQVNIMQGTTVVDSSVYSETTMVYPSPGVIPSVTYKHPATADYTFVLSALLPVGNYTVELANKAGHVFHMYSSPNETSNGVSTAPVCNGPPVPMGNLPEVPYAAAIPLAGLALGGIVWYRRTRLSA